MYQAADKNTPATIFFLIEVQLIYNVVVISGIQQIFFPL